MRRRYRGPGENKQNDAGGGGMSRMETYWGAGDKALGVGGAGKRQQYHLIKIIYHIVSIIY